MHCEIHASRRFYFAGNSGLKGPESTSYAAQRIWPASSQILLNQQCYELSVSMDYFVSFSPVTAVWQLALVDYPADPVYSMNGPAAPSVSYSCNHSNRSKSRYGCIPNSCNTLSSQLSSIAPSWVYTCV